MQNDARAQHEARSLLRGLGARAEDAANHDGVGREVGWRLAGERQTVATSATLYVSTR